ncbi:light-regulated signal transduction histidine kinase (bacteriophytochrome) [Pseudomonas sp. BIGb0408]|uniref:histidine kinase n=1 Tax=Phytopseudomonas flavescens TaxID=29435 RepID=A0A7Z0BMF5_9GAMM|nr:MULTISPECIES: HWE histidine kinase domain-containing protein [Pseudomonas]MCW2293651.1 light-regulated signal transduction histidine kinase (bacteriophytochrome) [Pseudomonas sp. BIGb0408]NYH71780.1 light-regulated signal transduction histidine kinase (bacteriophytochrome) [Pseudomonas flavescens]
MTLEPRVNLTNCDREAIQFPGSIQPHGCLLACNASASIVLRHSANAPDMLGAAGDLNDQRLEAVVGVEAAHSIRNSLARTREGSRPVLTFGLTLASGRTFDIAAHLFKGTAIIEFEPCGASIAEPIELARTLIAQVREIDRTDKLFRDSARMVRAMLGYDRVMIYQLGADGAGKVIAESKRSDLESFLGQYFPASDIPQQARALYLRNPIRIISDVRFKSVPVLPALDLSGEPVDLSYAHLRSVSPIHCEYLSNMGVGASMSISIIIDGALWGLIACHHYAPRTLTMGQRVAAEMFGEFLSMHIETLRARQKLEAVAQTRQVLDTLLLDANSATDMEEFFRSRITDFKALIPCDGIGMLLQGRWSEEGLTPPKLAAPALLSFIEGVAQGRTWASNRLSMAHVAAQDYASDVSGVLVIPMSQHPRDYLILFRKEVVETLDWAGDPNKTYESGSFGERLTPRRSFAIWKETVHHQSLPWTEQDRQFGEAIRVAIVEVVLHNSELLANERLKADVRQRMLNEELNHRVKNILALIGALVAHPTAEAQTLGGYVATLKGRIQALALAHDQVVRGDGGGSLAALLNAELSPYRTSADAIELHGPNVVLDARAYSVMALVLHELATNAAKYGALSRASGKLVVTWSVDAGGACDIAWTEAGGPPVRAPAHTGFGSVLIDRSIPFDLGGTSALEFLPEGLRGHFKIPAKHLSLADPAETEQPAALIALPTLDLKDLANSSVLILEDQLVIAVGLEQILADAGVEDVITASSEVEALRLLTSRRPDVAVLDINLGTGTSLAVAEELQRLQIPFIFATGYGDSIALPDELKDVCIVRKPYDAASILVNLQGLIDRPS